MDEERFTPAQQFVVLLIALVQFVNILDFVIMMPLGPTLAGALHFSEARVAMANASYTAAACVSGLIGSFLFDRFDRRKALAVALLGLVIGTAAGGFATGLPSLLAARVVAGAFGGPATSIAFSIIADVIPNRLRGRALGQVMAAFSVASVLGVPAGLFLAETFSWRAPFFAVSGVGLLVCLGAIGRLPPMRGHLNILGPQVSVGELLARPLVRLSYLMTAIVMGAGFLVIPNIAAYLQLDLGLPATSMKYAYLFGGIASFFATQGGGRAVDRLGSFKVGTLGAVAVIGVIFVFFVVPWTSAAPWAVYLGFVAFMTANGVRNVSYNTLTSKVPEPQVRARFQSLQSAVQHGATAVAGFASATMMSTEGPEGARRLVGMGRVALISMALSATIPAMLWLVERGVRAKPPPAPVVP